MAAVDHGDSKNILTGEDLIKMSQEKTRRLHRKMTGRELK